MTDKKIMISLTSVLSHQGRGEYYYFPPLRGGKRREGDLIH